MKKLLALLVILSFLFGIGYFSVFIHPLPLILFSMFFGLWLAGTLLGWALETLF
jgi:hypothetical protein